MSMNIRVSPRRALAPALSFALLASVLASQVLADPVTVTDQRGVRVTLSKSAERIVSIPIPHASVIMAVDKSPVRLVGIHPSARAAIELGLMRTIFPGSLAIRSDITSQGFMPNVETLLALRPDVVVQWANQGPDLISAVERTGLPVIGVTYGTEAFIRGAIEMYGDLIGRPDRAVELLAFRDAMKVRLDSALSGVAESRKPRVLHLSAAMTTLQVAASGTYQDVVIGMAGGRNVAGAMREFPTINPEQIVVWAPEVILLNGFEAQLFPEHIYRNPLFAGIPAVRDRRVYKLPLGGQRWDPPSHESPLTWLWQAILYHPDRITMDLRAEMKAAYRLLYGHDLTEAEVDDILRLSRHEGAAGYQRFHAR
jgi:iron complex transport system substrate-binding protein